LLHIDAVNDAIGKAARPGDVDPVIYVPVYNIGDAPSACCHKLYADVRILCPISGNGTSDFSFLYSFICIETQVDPLFGFAFIQTFVDILQEYFGTLSAATLRENFDVVYQV